jgi:hypothetical protein
MEGWLGRLGSALVAAGMGLFVLCEDMGRGGAAALL